MMNIHQCVAFSILMENGEGIMGKAPDYIWEKYRTCTVLQSDDELKGLLDWENQAKFDRWLDRWEKPKKED